ncbi:hypothetical protein V2K29_01965 [Pseudomonas alliivorans]|nr:hypothetical protein [Pseudomonas alliivorans]
MKARHAANADATGAYHIATSINKSVIDPGDEVYIEQYITGYGSIFGAKLQTYISPGSFDMENSSIRSSLKVDGKKLYWGGDIAKLSELGFTCVMAGLSINDQPPTMFLDLIENDNISGMPVLITERKMGHAPFEYSLKTRSDIKPGDYYMDFYLTYFNGEKWHCVKERVPFKVRNFFERHSKAVSWLAITATILGILRLAIIPAAMYITCLIQNL